MGKFEAIDKLNYKYTLEPEEEKLLDDTLGAISSGVAEEFLNIHNATLFNTLVARYVASVFYKNNVAINNDYDFVAITVTIPSQHRETKISIGKLRVKDKMTKLVSGVMYD